MFGVTPRRDESRLYESMKRIRQKVGQFIVEWATKGGYLRRNSIAAYIAVNARSTKHLTLGLE